MDAFFGMNIALKGLYTAQKSLDIVNHNVNNINTPGYSRQQVVQAASEPMAMYDGTGMVGTGSVVTSVEGIRDGYLDFKYWSENVALGEWNTKQALLADVETTFNEPSDSGFNKISEDFFGSLQELAKDPGNSALRSLVKERGISFTKYFNNLSYDLEKIQSDTNYKVNVKVQDINSLGTQIQKLNEQIYTGELDGNVANDLRDQRGVLIDKLSKLVNIDVSEVTNGKLPSGKDDKRLLITISGKPFVDHYDTTKLKIDKRTNKLNEEDTDNLYGVKWSDGNSLTIKGGELKGLLDVRDGNEAENGSPNYKGIPYYIKKLNQFVRTMAMAANEGYVDKNSNTIIESDEVGIGHAGGYGVDPDGKSGTQTATQNIRFFTLINNDNVAIDSEEFIGDASGLTDDLTTTDINESIVDRYKNITAKNFTVSADILNNLNAIATSDNEEQIGNINVLNQLIELRHSNTMFSEGAPEDFVKSIVSSMAIDSQQAQKLTTNQGLIVKQIENNRTSVSGVSVDEEMANMIKYQHAYNAAAKMVSTMAEIYDQLINRVGVN